MVTKEYYGIIEWTSVMCICKLRWTEEAWITFGKTRLTYQGILNIFYI